MVSMRPANKKTVAQNHGSPDGSLRPVNKHDEFSQYNKLN
jgi:hypothetical protein